MINLKKIESEINDGKIIDYITILNNYNYKKLGKTCNHSILLELSNSKSIQVFKDNYAILIIGNDSIAFETLQECLIYLIDPIKTKEKSKNIFDIHEKIFLVSCYDYSINVMGTPKLVSFHDIVLMGEEDSHLKSNLPVYYNKTEEELRNEIDKAFCLCYDNNKGCYDYELIR